jgi:prepilin-type processing-associated H-X9-DG protein
MMQGRVAPNRFFPAALVFISGTASVLFCDWHGV